jgi:hypothetical protein
MDRTYFLLRRLGHECSSTSESNSQKLLPWMLRNFAKAAANFSVVVSFK